MIRRRSTALTIAQQSFLLQHSTTGEVTAGPGWLEFRAQVQPTVLSRIYDLLIRYDLGEHPVSTVMGPNLGNLTDKKIPHLWKHGPYELCLYFSRNKEWTPRMHIAKTIFPWCAEWLFHFESWLGTGVWDGGGTVH